jgi:hypothetical protein
MCDGDNAVWGRMYTKVAHANTDVIRLVRAELDNMQVRKRFRLTASQHDDLFGLAFDAGHKSGSWSGS